MSAFWELNKDQALKLTEEQRKATRKETLERAEHMLWCKMMELAKSIDEDRIGKAGAEKLMAAVTNVYKVLTSEQMAAQDGLNLEILQAEGLNLNESSMD